MPLTERNDGTYEIRCGCGKVFRCSNWNGKYHGNDFHCAHADALWYAHLEECPILRCAHCLNALVGPPWDTPENHKCPWNKDIK